MILYVAFLKMPTSDKNEYDGAIERLVGFYFHVISNLFNRFNPRFLFFQVRIGPGCNLGVLSVN